MFRQYCLGILDYIHVSNLIPSERHLICPIFILIHDSDLKYTARVIKNDPLQQEE